MKKRTKSVRAVYLITFELEVNLTPEEAKVTLDESESIQEAVTSLIDEELSGHNKGGTRCGVSFYDAGMFGAEFVEVRK